MKFAPIPPTDLLYERDRTFHLCLAHVLLGNVRQLEYYQQWATSVDDYVILDNGAYELGHSFRFEHVLEVAREILPDEIVLPDVFLDAGDTIKEALKGYDLLRQDETWDHVNLMVAPQGATTTEWMHCLDTLASSIEPDIIGIPVVYESRMGRGVLVKKVIDYLGDGEYQPHIHLLGWDGDLFKLESYAKEFPHVIRGTDSAKPYYYSMLPAPSYISEGKQIVRPHGYFDLPGEAFHTRYLSENLDAIFSAAEGHLVI